MKPYFDDGTVQLYLGDCREVLPALGVTADLVIADPPYGETSLTWDVWPAGWLQAIAPVSKSLWCFGSMRMFLRHGGEIEAAGWQLSQDVIWRKQNATGFAADRFRRVHEHVLHWYQGRWKDLRISPVREVTGVREPGRTVKQGRDHAHHLGEIGEKSGWVDDGTRLAISVIEARNRHRAGAIHPTEKPVDLLDPLIRYACPVGGLVVDPFAGSASTLVAARLSGRRAIGVEADKRYAEKAAQRLAQEPLDFGEAS